VKSRSVKDADGRTWAVREDSPLGIQPREGQDVSVLCTTPTVIVPVRLTVDAQWHSMAESGLARLICAASPAPRR